MIDNWNLYSKLMHDYDKSYDYEGINGKRIAERLHELSLIGLTENGGSRRFGYSEEERKAKSLMKGWMEKAGLSVKEDGAGNLFGRLEGRDPTSPAIMSGSHLDSVPDGGHFDGPLGVLSALEVAQAWQDENFLPSKPYEVAVFSDEEGSRFNSGLLGSRAMTGVVDTKSQEQLQDHEGNSFREVLEQKGLSLDSFQEPTRNLNGIDTYVEVHIEQGKVLEKENLPVGIVTGIAGPSWIEFEFTGVAGHAGNTPMQDRHDALVAAGEFVSKIHPLPKSINESSVATVGKLHVFPNGANVIPGKVQLIVDVRDISKESKEQLIQLIEKQAEETADLYGVNLHYRRTLNVAPVPIQEELRSLMGTALKKHGIRPLELPSGAGHDALIIGHQLPVSMLFVRSEKGISHTPEEWSSLNDCVQGVHVLKSYIESLMTQ